MTLSECVALLTPLALACRAEMDGPSFRAYHRVLITAPARLVDAGIERLIQTGLRYGMPSAPQILAASEDARKAYIAAHPWVACRECAEVDPGWRAVLIDDVTRLERCPCKERYAATLARLGVTHEPLALAAGSDE